MIPRHAAPRILRLLDGFPVVTITGQPVNDATLSRTIQSRVRMRNEGVDFLVSPTQVCP